MERVPPVDARRRAPVSGLLARIRDALRGGGTPTLHQDPSDSVHVFVPRPVQDSLSDEAGDEESSLEVLIVGVGPTNIDLESSKAGKFAQGYSRNAGLAYPPMLTGSMFEEKDKAAFFGNHEESKSWWSFESLQSQFYGWKRKFYQGKDILESLKKWPGLFEELGSDARGLLYDDFVAKSLKGSMSFSVGMSVLDKETVTKLLFSGKYCNSTLALNGTRTEDKNDIANNTVVSTLIFHDVLGPHTKVMLHIPQPYLSQKLEVSMLHRFAGFTGRICSRAPHLEASCLLGKHLFAVGGLIQLNKESGDVDYSVGITSRISTIAGSFFVSNKRNLNSVEAFFFKKFENDVTSVALTACHCFENQPWDKTTSAIIGVTHEFPHSVTIKGRLSSEGVASALLKMRFLEFFSVVLCTDVELRDVQKVPKFGVMFSIL
ncbi:hypothetical protein ACQ4PT_040284 [Festuca glaucescens]